VQVSVQISPPLFLPPSVSLSLSCFCSDSRCGWYTHALGRVRADGRARVCVRVSLDGSFLFTQSWGFLHLFSISAVRLYSRSCSVHSVTAFVGTAESEAKEGR
jgi:hypothetical protein